MIRPSIADPHSITRQTQVEEMQEPLINFRLVMKARGERLSQDYISCLATLAYD